MHDFVRDYFGGTEGQVYVCAIRNADSKLPRGELDKICTRDLKALENFIGKCDLKVREHGIYFAATLKPGAESRQADNCHQFPSIFADIDDKNHDLSRAAILERLKQVESPPTLIIDSGHGLQAHWLLSEPSDDADRIVAARKMPSMMRPALCVCRARITPNAVIGWKPRSSPITRSGDIRWRRCRIGSTVRA